MVQGKLGKHRKKHKILNACTYTFSNFSSRHGWKCNKNPQHCERTYTKQRKGYLVVDFPTPNEGMFQNTREEKLNRET